MSANHTRIVDQDVDLARNLFGAIRQFRARFSLLQVGSDSPGSTPDAGDGFDRLGTSILSGTRADDVGPGLGQREGDGAAQPPACAGNERALSVNAKLVEDAHSIKARLFAFFQVILRPFRLM